MVEVAVVDGGPEDGGDGHSVAVHAFTTRDNVTCFRYASRRDVLLFFSIDLHCPIVVVSDTTE